MTPVLELSNVRAGYGTIDVLHGVNLKVEPGQVYALLGPNGAGKTTTLGVCSGQIAPSAGQLLPRRARGQRRQQRRAGPGRGVPRPRGPRGVPQPHRHREPADVHPRRQPRSPRCRRWPSAQFPRLKERRKQISGTLSGGEQQMLALSRALATEPALLLLDELSMGLAPLVVEELYGRVAELATPGHLDPDRRAVRPGDPGRLDDRLDHAARPHHPYRTTRRDRRGAGRGLPRRFGLDGLRLTHEGAP